MKLKKAVRFAVFGSCRWRTIWCWATTKLEASKPKLVCYYRRQEERSITKFNPVGDSNQNARLTAIDICEPIAKLREPTILDLENGNSKGGDHMPKEWSLDKQIDGDIRVGLMGLTN